MKGGFAVRRVPPYICQRIYRALSLGSNSNGNIQGMAPAAQITMLSMGPDNSTSLSVPLDLTTGVFQDAYGDGRENGQKNQNIPIDF